ncbi:MAG: alginate export family protein, partial [Gemmatimonadetes bacterium]|nr:alginate export family protein [Gemmatimonadota bacterium]
MSFTHATLWPLALILLLGPTNDSSAELRIGGQVRPRLEFRDPAAGGQDDSFTSMRVRAQLQTTLERDVSVFVQWQDVRLWGEETNTLGDFSADSFDLHQGYVDFGNVGGRSLSIRLGRQEISLGGQRLV